MLRPVGASISPLVVENRAGGGGVIAIDTALAAPADGHTIVMGSISTLVMIPATQAKPTYDPLRDLTPITLMATVPYALACNPSLPVRSLGELVKLAKAQPGTLGYGSAGHATGTHLAAEYFASTAGIQLLHVPYKGSGPAMVDLISGQIPLSFVTASSVQPYLLAGKVRGLAMAAATRTTTMPMIPTFNEQGYPGFEAGSWIGIVVRAGTPPAIVRRLHTDILRHLQVAEVRTAIENQGNTVITSTPEEFERYILDETRKWKQVIAKAKIRIQ
jgi:tripartite-type tricarboxylate transporter receptor subunit TctC